MLFTGIIPGLLGYVISILDIEYLVWSKLWKQAHLIPYLNDLTATSG